MDASHPFLAADPQYIEAHRPRLHVKTGSAFEVACDLLAERIHGNPARSAGHNARLQIESVIAELRAAQGVK